MSLPLFARVRSAIVPPQACPRSSFDGTARLPPSHDFTLVRFGRSLARALSGRTLRFVVVFAIGLGTAHSCRGQDSVQAIADSINAVNNSDVSAPNAGQLAEQLSDWEYFAEVKIPAGSDPAQSNNLRQFHLPPAVFSKSRSDLLDLRLFDSQTQAVPFALRVLESKTVRESINSRRFNDSISDEGARELTVDLASTEYQHNEVEIIVSGSEYRRKAELEGSDDGQDWKPLAEGFLLDFRDDKTRFERKSLTYSDSRLRYLRFTVHPDPAKPNAEGNAESFTVNEVRVLHTVQQAGEKSTTLVGPVKREPTRFMGAPGSQWTIDLGGENVPVSELEIEVADREFARDLQILAESPAYTSGKKSFYPLALNRGSTWQRTAGDAISPIVVQFNEVQTSRLRIQINDYRNAPLTIQQIHVRAAARQVIFELPATDGDSLKLFMGNPLAEPAQYDFDRNLPIKIAPSPEHVLLGDVTANPEFVPPPEPWTERLPWLVYVVLGGVTLVLGVIIVNLARHAMQLHDSLSKESMDLGSIGQ